MRINHSMVKSIIFVLLYGFSATQVLHAATATKEEISDGELEIADDEESVATSKRQDGTMDKNGAILPKTDVHDFLQQKLGDNWKTLINKTPLSVLHNKLGNLPEDDERWKAILKLRKQAKNRIYQSDSRKRTTRRIETLQAENTETQKKLQVSYQINTSLSQQLQIAVQQLQFARAFIYQLSVYQQQQQQHTQPPPSAFQTPHSTDASAP